MAGRQIKPFKGTNDLYDAGHRHVYAEKIQPLPDNLKKKIVLILEAFPSKSKSEIAEVLQACDYDVTKALNCFVADGGMEGQNEWMVQGKRKKKKKKPGKKGAKDTNDSQSQNDAECSATTTASVDLPASTNEKQTEAGEKKVEQNIPAETTAEGHPTDKPTTANNENPTSLKNLKPVSNDVLKSSETTPTPTSPLPSSPVLSPLLSPTDSLSSSQDLQTLNKSRTGSSSNEKHPRQRTTSGSGADIFKRTLKDLQRSAVSISRYQSILDEQADMSTKMLAKSFQAIRQTLDEREKCLEEQLQSVTEEAKKLLQERQEDAAVLKFKCNRVGTMSDEETTELRSEIKHFVGERKIDEDLGKIILFICDEEKMLETVKSFGEVPPIKHHYTSYKRKHPEPSKPVSHKPPPVKTTTALSSTATTAPANVTTTSNSSEVKNSNSRNERRQVLSPAGLKDQAEMHARLQQAVKQQQVSPVSKESTKQLDRNASEKPKPKDFGSKSNRNNNSKEQQSRREQTSQRQRPTGSSQNSTKTFGNRKENKSTDSENSKTQVQSNGAKAQDGSPGDGESQAQYGSPADNGAQGKDHRTQAKANKPVGSSHVTENHGDRRTRRQYVRKTPVGDGGSVFRTGTVKASNNSSSINENGDQSKVKSPDLPNGQIESPTTNGKNGFVPLPQRNRRSRKYYLKKEPGSKIEFPPARENGSVPA